MRQIEKLRKMAWKASWNFDSGFVRVLLSVKVSVLLYSHLKVSCGTLQTYSKNVSIIISLLSSYTFVK